MDEKELVRYLPRISPSSRAQVTTVVNERNVRARNSSVTALLALPIPVAGAAQSQYFNSDAAHPLRIEDAVPPSASPSISISRWRVSSVSAFHALNAETSGEIAVPFSGCQAGN